MLIKFILFTSLPFWDQCDSGFTEPPIPALGLTAISMDSLVPDWSWYNTTSSVQIFGNFTMEPGYTILNSTLTVRGPTGLVTSISGAMHFFDHITVIFPVFGVIGQHCFTLTVNVGTYAESNRFEVTAPENLCFFVAPSLGQLHDPTVSNGPPSGGTEVSFSFNMNPRSKLIDLDCVFGDQRAPLVFSFPLNPSDSITGSCSSPTARSDRYLCLQLAPGNTSFALYPTVQDSNGLNCDSTNSFTFNFYSQMPILDVLTPRSGIDSGGSSVIVTGVNFPEQRSSNGDVQCRFGPSGVVSGSRLNESAVACSPAPSAIISGALAPATTLSVSFNSGRNFAPNPLTFTYVPTFLISSITPLTGISSGSTRMDLVLSTTSSSSLEVSPLNGPTRVCLYAGDGTYLATQAATLVTSNFSRIELLSQPLLSLLPTADPTAANSIKFSIQQEDGQCGPLTNGLTFTYRSPWLGTGVTPGVITGGSVMRLNVTGDKFFSSAGSLCALTATWPSGTVMKTYQKTCNVTGDFFYLNNTNGYCEVDLESASFYECGYEAAAHVLQAQSQPPSEELLWESMTVNVAIAMNGRDFATVTDNAQINGPIPIRAIRLPIIRSVEPDFGFDYGGYIMELNLETGVAWHATLCVFTQGSRRVDVKASPYSMRTVACIAPRWSLAPGLLSQTVNIQLQINTDEVLTAPFAYTFHKSPSIVSFYPREGPAAGNTDLTLVGKGFDQSAFPTSSWSLQCVFGQTKATSARMVSDTEIHCRTPSSNSAGPVTLDLSLNWQSGPSNRLSKVSLLQSIFRYLPTQLQITNVWPMLGPIVGGTFVTVTTSSRISNTGLIRCLFGNNPAPGEYVNDYEFYCKSPAVGAPGNITLTLSLEGQTAPPANSNEKFTFRYYRPPSIGAAIPAFGSSVGGTKVLVEGAFFINSANISCKFADVEVMVKLYISPQQVVCESPGGPLGAVGLSVSNNGLDYTTVLEDGFTFVESQPLLIMNPTIGPVTGGTVVRITPAYNGLSSTIVQSSIASGGPRCSFGSRTVGGYFSNITSGEVECLTPSFPIDGFEAVSVNYNGQESAFVSQQFLFHNLSTLSSIDPPMAPLGVPSTVTINGSNFVNADSLTVRFGAPSVGYIDVPGLWISDTQIRCNPPSVSPAGESILRVPVMVSNNGQDFVPSTINNWDPDDDSFAVSGVAQYYTFHFPMVLHTVFPSVSTISGGGFVSVYGGPFLASPTLACGFDRIVSAIDHPILVSSTHLLCPVPNMWTANAPISKTIKLQIALVPNRWSDSYLLFDFLISNAVPGLYVPSGSGQPLPCDMGHMCETPGLTAPIACPPGTYQPFPNQLQCMPCAVGHYCPHVRLIAPVLCTGGWVCNEEGLILPYKRCPSGYICVAGTGSLDPVPDEPFVALAPSNLTAGLNAPYRCLIGMYCLEGTAAFVSIVGNFSTPQPCYQAYYCPPGSGTPYGIGAAPLGRYAPTPKHPGILCPERYFCGPLTGNMWPKPCTAGSYNGLAGQHNCTLSPEGYVAPAPFLSLPIKSECGYVAGRKGISTLSEADLCPVSAVCDYGVASAVEPKICVELPTSDASLCDASVGQVFHDVLGALTPARLNSSSAHCCWNNAQVVLFAQRIEKIFSAMPTGGARLEALAARRFRQEIQRQSLAMVSLTNNNGFDGKVLLDLVNRESLRTDFGVHIASVRERIVLEIERYFTFTSPDPCPPGVFCNRGTCAGYNSLSNVAVER